MTRIAPLATALTGAFALALLPAEAAPQAADAAADVIREWQVPYEDSRPRDPYVGPDGRVWFVGQRTHYVAVLDPESGDFQKFDLEPGTGPHNLIVDDEGIVWYAGNRAEHIGRLDPSTGEIEKIPTPGVRDPHTLVFGPDGTIWFTAQGANVVGHLDPASREVRIVPVPTDRARPYGIVVDESGRPWIAEVGTNKIGTVDPATMAYEEIVLPRDGARPRRIGLTGDGVVWYVDYAEGYLGRVDPGTRAIQEWLSPSGAQARPYAMAVDAHDRLWFVETGPQPNRFVYFDPKTEEFTVAGEVPSGGGTVRHMVFHEPTGVIWFGADTNTIGRTLANSGGGGR